MTGQALLNTDTPAFHQSPLLESHAQCDATKSCHANKPDAKFNWAAIT